MNLLQTLGKYNIHKHVVATFAGALALYSTTKSFELAFFAIANQAMDAVLVSLITIIQVPVMAVLAFVPIMYKKEGKHDGCDINGNSHS